MNLVYSFYLKAETIFRFVKDYTQEIRMGVLFYTASKKGAAKRVEHIIEGLVPQKDIEIYHTSESFSQRLRRFRGDLYLMVVLTTTADELREIFLIRDLLFDIPLILILPDREPDTIAKGHKFRPRFITYADGDFNEFGLVLEKMTQRIRASMFQWQSPDRSGGDKEPHYKLQSKTT